MTLNTLSTRKHRFPIEHFEELAVGGGDGETIRLLLAGEYSRRLLLLRALLGQAAKQPSAFGPLPPPDDVWRMLAQLDQRARSSAALRDVLMHPQFGTSLARAIRLLNTEASSGTPTWVEAGQIHAAIFAAAIRGRQRLSTRLPLRDGYALLPTLGLAHLPTHKAWEIAQAETVDGRVRLSASGHDIALPADLDREDAHWWPLRRIAVEADQRVLRVRLDDIDPNRDLADPVPPRRLNADAVAEWVTLLSDAWRILNRACPETAEAIGAGLASIAPLPESGTGETRSASTGDAFGAALISPPPDPETLAVSLVHEFQHIKLGGLLHLFTLHHDDAGPARLYAPWRDDPRPLSGLLQGVYAFLGIAEFWRSHRLSGTERDQNLGDFEFAYARCQTWRGLQTLRSSPLLTDLGRRFTAGMQRQLRRQMSDRVGADAVRAAWAAATEHFAAWRLRHLRPDPDRVAELANAYPGPAETEPIPAIPFTLAPTQVGLWYRSRLALHRLRLTEPARFDALRAESRGGRPPRGATWADVALVRGNSHAAAGGYLSAITVNHDDVDAWTGLGLAIAASGSSGAWRSLVQRPELVRSTYLAVRQRKPSVSPVDVAAWLYDIAPPMGAPEPSS